MKQEFIRHGDVILLRVDKIKGKQTKHNELILAEGEVTGHFHKLKTQTSQILESFDNGSRYIELTEPVELTHQEHDTLEIPKGCYQVLLQREVDLLGEVRQVMD